ncbi:MAG: hypothetical protein FWH26_05550 [Oscillospiraceae bacterium]|nr:hypothetical protein [Oscillospiraceae bacterium]
MTQKIAAALVCLLHSVLMLIPPYAALEPYARDQIAPSIVHVPAALLSYPFKAKSSSEVTLAKVKAGGFIKGVCHGNDNTEQMKGAGLGWNRSDIPFPFDENGGVRQEYKNYKERTLRLLQGGIKTMAVTPYPREYLKYGIDPRTDTEGIRSVAEFLITDLRDIVGALQITNELGVPRFSAPMESAQECVRFIGLTMQAMAPLKGNVLVGYNSAGPQVDHHLLMKPWLPYCDYVGLDMYVGTFIEFANWMFLYDLILDFIWSFTGKPVILCEFGYMSEGAAKTPEEKRVVLERYGVSSEAEARENIEAFVDALPAKMRDRVKNEASDYANYIFNTDFRNHLYAELPEKVVIKGYPHTPEGQAGFYTDIFARFEKKTFLVGAFIYCYSDSAECYYCGQSDCPVETRWGLVYMDGTEKSSYYAVKEALEKFE